MPPTRPRWSSCTVGTSKMKINARAVSQLPFGILRMWDSSVPFVFSWLNTDMMSRCLQSHTSRIARLIILNSKNHSIWEPVFRISFGISLWHHFPLVVFLIKTHPFQIFFSHEKISIIKYCSICGHTKTRYR